MTFATSFFSFFSHLFIFILLKRQTCGRKAFIHWITPQMPLKKPRLGQGEDRSLGLLHGWQTSHARAITCCLCVHNSTRYQEIGPKAERWGLEPAAVRGGCLYQPLNCSQTFVFFTLPSRISPKSVGKGWTSLKPNSGVLISSSHFFDLPCLLDPLTGVPCCEEAWSEDLQVE